MWKLFLIPETHMWKHYLIPFRPDHSLCFELLSINQCIKNNVTLSRTDMWSDFLIKGVDIQGIRQDENSDMALRWRHFLIPDPYICGKIF